IQPDLDAFLLQDVFDGGRHIFIFTLNQARALLDDRDFAAKATIHLPELESDIAPANNDQMPRQKIDTHHGTVREIGNLFNTWQGGYHGPCAHVDEEPLSREPGIADADLPSRFETRAALVHGAVIQMIETVLESDSRLAGDLIFAGFDAFHVHADGAVDRHAEVGGATRHMRGVCARHHRLGRDAARVDASAAE